MEIITFAGGLVTNVAEHASRGREAYAAYCRDCRSDEQGWLVARAGRVNISSEVGFTEVFAHKTFLLAVIDGTLKWARIHEAGAQLRFFKVCINFDTPISISGNGHVIFKATEDLIFVADESDQYVVDVSGDVPVASHFYGQIGGIHLTSYRPTRTENKFVTGPLTAEQTYDNLEDRVKNSIRIEVIDVFAQPVMEIGGERVLLTPTNTLRAEVNSWDASPDQAGFGSEGKWRAEITIQMSGVAPEFMVSRNVIVELYATRRVAEGETPKTDFFRLPTTITYEPGTTVTFRLLNDDSTLGDPAPLRPGTMSEHVNFKYMAVNEFRTYAAEANSDRVWLSRYDAEQNETNFHNFTDSIQLQLQGGTITGLQFIRDNLLVVYATNQIQLIATDPLAELHEVIDTVGPRDDVGNLIGCIAPDSIVDMGGEHFFLGSNRHVYRFNGRTVRTISDPVQAIFDAIELPITKAGEPEISRAVAFAYEKDYFISIPSMLEGDM